MVLPEVFYYAAQSIELVFLVALAWCFAGVGLAGFASFSTSIGAFLAGFAISDLPFSFEIKDKAKGLRDFGILLFFLSVGLKLEITKAIFTNWHFYLLIAFVLFFTPVITAIITSMLRFTKREIFVMSLLPAEISEFTLIIVTFGLTAGHLSSEIYTMITLIIIITIMISSVVIENINKFYKAVENKIDFLEWRHAKIPEHLKKDLKKHVVLFGFKKLGQYAGKFYRDRNKEVIVVDWRPKAIRVAKRLGCMMVYGDAGDPDMWEEVSLSKASAVISTIGENISDDVNLIKYMKKHNPKALKIVETNHTKEAKLLYKLGADVVLVHDNLEWNDLELYLKANAAKRRKLKKIFKV
jgi:FlaA1/EpsC-like NDP-sugar epimerase